MQILQGYSICELDDGGYIIQANEYDGINDLTPSKLRDRFGEVRFGTYSQAVVVLATHLLKEIA
jgi:hypothetical protein